MNNEPVFICIGVKSTFFTAVSFLEAVYEKNSHKYW